MVIYQHFFCAFYSKRVMEDLGFQANQKNLDLLSLITECERSDSRNLGLILVFDSLTNLTLQIFFKIQNDKTQHQQNLFSIWYDFLLNIGSYHQVRVYSACYLLLRRTCWVLAVRDEMLGQIQAFGVSICG